MCLPLWSSAQPGPTAVVLTSIAPSLILSVTLNPQPVLVASSMVIVQHMASAMIINAPSLPVMLTGTARPLTDPSAQGLKASSEPAFNAMLIATALAEPAKPTNASKILLLNKKAVICQAIQAVTLANKKKVTWAV